MRKAGRVTSRFRWDRATEEVRVQSSAAGSPSGRESGLAFTVRRPWLPGQESNLRRTHIQSVVAPASRATRDRPP